MPVAAAARYGSALSYVEELEYRKELARQVAKAIMARANVYELLGDPDGTVGTMLSDLLAGISGSVADNRDLLEEIGTEAIAHLSSLGIEGASISEQLTADLPSIIEDTSHRIMSEADAYLSARAAEIARSVERMVGEGATEEVIAAAIGAEGGQEAILAPLMSGMTQTAAGLVSGVDTAVTREGATLDSALAALPADQGGEETEAIYGWETRGDEAVCDDIFEDSCAPRDGEELTLSEWEAFGLPGGENLICSMFAKGAFSNCRCKVLRVGKAERVPGPLKIADAAQAGKDRALSEMPSSVSSEGVSGLPSRKSPSGIGAGPIHEPLPASQVSITRPGETLATIPPSSQQGSITDFSVPKTTLDIQPPGPVEDLLKLADEANPSFTEVLSRIAEKENRLGVTFDPTQAPRVKKYNPDDPMDRLVIKLKTRSPQRVADYLGGRLMVENEAGIRAVIDDLREAYGAPLEIDDFRQFGKKGGYRAVHVEVRLPNGLAAEVQIIPRQVAEAKELWTAVYDKWRNYETMGPIPDDLMAAYNRDQAAMEAAYKDAYERWLRGEEIPAGVDEPGPLQLRSIDDERAALAPPPAAIEAPPGATTEEALAAPERAAPADAWANAETGKPIVAEAYHGSSADVPALKMGRAETGAGLYLTDDWTVAEGYGQWVYLSEIRLNNPMVFDAENQKWYTLPIERLIREAKAAGHDGLVIKNIFDSKGLQLSPSTTIIAFNENAVSLSAKIDMNIPTSTWEPVKKPAPAQAPKPATPALSEEGRNVMSNILLPPSKEGAEGLAEKIAKATIDTAASKDPEALNAVFRNAAVSEAPGEITVWHVTGDPERLIKTLEEGGDLWVSFGRESGDLGPGLYGSAVPQLWTGRAGSKYEFILGMPLDQRKVLGDAILASDHFTMQGYLTKSEIETARRLVAQFVDSGLPYGLVELADQPYNIAFWKPSFLEPLGIKPAVKMPQVVAITLRGRFFNLTDSWKSMLWSTDAETLRAMGYDGAFVGSGFSSTPQLVVWNRSAIVGWKLDPDIAKRIMQ